MQLIVKYITISSVLFHFSVGCDFSFGLDHNKNITSLKQQKCCHHTNHQDTNVPVKNDDCCNQFCKCTYLVNRAPRVISDGACIELILQHTGIVSSNLLNLSLDSCDCCNTLTSAFRLLTDVWLL